MRTSQRSVLFAATTAAVALVAVTLAPANAGHSNTVIVGDLTGRAEVGPTPGIVGDPNGRGEVYVFGVDGDPTTLCYVLIVDKIGPATAAHIHDAGAGAARLTTTSPLAPGDGNAADCLTEGEVGKFVGDQTVAEILANPSDYYVNVHNAEFPGGAIRGQLAPQS